MYPKGLVECLCCLTICQSATARSVKPVEIMHHPSVWKSATCHRSDGCKKSAVGGGVTSWRVESTVSVLPPPWVGVLCLLSSRFRKPEDNTSSKSPILTVVDNHGLKQIRSVRLFREGPLRFRDETKTLNNQCEGCVMDTKRRFHLSDVTSDEGWIPRSQWNPVDVDLTSYYLHPGSSSYAGGSAEPEVTSIRENGIKSMGFGEYRVARR